MTTRIPQALRLPPAAAAVLGGRLVSGAATLAATPVLLAQLGPRGFGTWAVLIGALAIAAYADLGLGSAMTRHAASASIGADHVLRCRAALALGLTLSSCLGVLLGAAVLAMPTVLGAGAPAGPVRVAALLLAGALVADGAGNAARAILDGTGRMAVAGALTAATSAGGTLLGVAGVLGGLGIAGLAAATAAAAAARAAVLWTLAHRREPALSPSLAPLRGGGGGRGVLRYSLAVQVSQAGGAVNAETDRLVVAGLGGAAAAAGLDVALRLTSLLALVPFCVLYAVFPQLARLIAEGDTERLERLYRQTTRQLAYLTLVGAALLVAGAGPLLTLWLGRSMPLATASLVALAPAIAARTLTGPAAAVCRAEGRPGLETRFVAATAGLNVALTVPLVIALGPVGAPVATAAAAVLGGGAFLVSFHRATGRRLRTLAADLAAPAAAALLAGLAAWFAGRARLDGAGSRADAALTLAAQFALGLAFAAAVPAAIHAIRALGDRRRRHGGDGTHPRGDATAPAWVVYLSAIAWAGVRNRQHELALQAAVTRCVLFVEPPTLRPSWRLRVDRPAPALWRAAPLALLPFGRLIPWANAINRSYSGLRLRRWLDRHAGERLVVVDEDLAAPLAGRLGARARLYDAADLDWTFTRAWNRRHLRRALGAAVAGADAVTTSSPVLADHLPACRAPVIELLNACDASHFAGEPPVPAALAALPGPRIGYVGAVDRRAFDAELVAAVARARPAWTFVLAGPVDPRVGACFAGVANVHLLGPVPYDRLPALLGACDVCLVPYRVGGRIDYVQPKKLLEYLAAGKPVVTTDLPALRTAGLPVRRASGPAAFAAAIAAELDHGPDAQMVAERRRCARRHTWDARGRTLRAVLDRLEAAR